VDGACCNKAEIPDSPPDWAHPKARGTQARTPVIKIVSANRFAIEQSLVVSIAAFHGSVTHLTPLLVLKAQQMGNSAIGVRSLNSGSWKPSEVYNGKRTNIVMFISNAA
jgi:hypothetical protein